MAGLSSTGFSVKRLDEVKSSLETKARELFQDLVPVGDAVDTSENTAIGRLIGLATLYTTDLWEAALDTYSAFNASTATGNALDNICALLNIQRKEAVGTTVSLLIEGNESTAIPLSPSKTVASTTTSKLYELQPITTGATNVTITRSGGVGIGISIPSPANSTVYSVDYSFDAVTFTTVSVTSPGSGSTEASILAQLKTAINTSHSTYLTAYDQDGKLFIQGVDLGKLHWFDCSANVLINKAQIMVDAICTETGATVEAAGSVSSIATPYSGWDSATNPEAGVAGYDRETDEQLRARFYISKSQLASGHYDAISTAVQAVDGVTEMIIYENKTGSTDSNSITAYTNMIVVNGGVDSDVAKAIFDNIALNTKLQGNTTVTVPTVLGSFYSIKFERPTSHRLYMDIDITYTTSVTDNIIADIKQALVDYFAGFGVGESVLYSRVFIPINSVDGFYINHMYIDDDATLTSADVVNITVPFNKIASLAASDITVTVT